MRKVVFFAVLSLMAAACFLNSCNVTRTVESYDGKVDATKLLELAR